jgi:hypothetical protein
MSDESETPRAHTNLLSETPVVIEQLIGLRRWFASSALHLMHTGGWS